MWANSWIRLINIKGLKKTSNSAKEKLRLSLRKGGISGQTDTIITGREGIMSINQDLIMLRSSVRCSESQCIKYWRRLKMNRSLNDQIRWWETLKSVIITSIANIIRIMGIPQGIVGVCGITWTNLFERANWSSYYIILVAWGPKLILGLKEIFLQDPLWELSMLSLLH